MVVTESPKDTSVEDTLKETYKPALATFEEEVMMEMGIVDDRKRKITYWY